MITRKCGPLLFNTSVAAVVISVMETCLMVTCMMATCAPVLHLHCTYICGNICSNICSINWIVAKFCACNEHVFNKSMMRAMHTCSCIETMRLWGHIFASLQRMSLDAFDAWKYSRMQEMKAIVCKNLESMQRKASFTSFTWWSTVA